MATVNVTTDDFQEIVQKDGIVLLDFWAEWCGPCRQFGPIFERVSEEHEGIVFGKIDTEAEQTLGAQLQVTSIPTVMAFRDGVLVFREAGALPEPALKDLIEQIKNLDMVQVKAQAQQNGS